MNGDKLIDSLNWRYAVKKFDPTKKLSDDQWKTLEASLVLTPSSYGLQPWKFVVVTNPEMKTTLKAQSWNQPQVEECSHLVVFCCREKMDEAYVAKYVDDMAQTRNIPRESLAKMEEIIVGDVVNGPRSAISKEWASRQCYIALGQAMATAALLQVDGCPLEGINTSQYDELLGLKDTGYASVCALALGFRSAEDPLASAAKVRFPTSEIIDLRS